MANIPIEVNTGQTKTITFHTADTFSTEDITFSITAAGGDANTTLSGFAYCETAAATAAKTATMPGFELVTGQRIILQTTVANSATSNVTLSVNGTTAKPIKIGTANPTGSNFPASWWIANYDGTNWVLTRVYLSDTDTKVTQTITTSSNSSWRPLILGSSYSDAATFSPATTTNTTYATHLAKFKPSTGVLGIVGLNKMTTSGTVTTGSDNALWNTNGGTTTIATVATSGSYTDLSNKPTIPTKTSELTNDSGFTTNTGTVTSVKVGTTSYSPSGGVVSLPAYPTNTDTNVTPVALSATGTTNYNILLANNSSTPTTNGKPNYATTAKINGKGEITASKFKLIDGNGFLMADGSVDDSVYALESHGHDGMYQPAGNYKTTQAAVSDPTASTTTSTTFIDTISQDANGVITATKKTLPTYLSAVTALSATPAASLSSKTLTFKQFSQAASAQVSAANSSTKLYFNTAPSSTNTIATMSDVNSAFQANDAMVFKGTLGTGGTATSLPATHYQGWTYKVITAGTWAGVTCEVGDMVICITDGTSANNAHWTVVQSNIDGAVTGPASSASGNVVTFNGTTGKLIQDSGFTIGKSVPSDAEFTDTKVTSSANHYTPETASGQNKSASATGATAAWSIDVVKGVTLNTDGKGHVTGISVTSGKIPGNPNTDTKVSQSSTTTANYRKVLLAHTSNASAGADVVTETDVVYGAKLVEVQPSTGTLRANAFVKVDGSASQFLKADGSVDDNVYAFEGHNHDGVYQPVGNYKTTQTAVSDPATSTTTATAFIDTISQDTNGVITVTKKSLPSYSSSTHTHGNITNAGALQTTDVTIANGDKLVVTDASNSNKIARTSLAFDGSTTTQFLTKKGTFASLPAASTTVAGITTVGASGGAAAYSHSHSGYLTSVGLVASDSSNGVDNTASSSAVFLNSIKVDSGGNTTVSSSNKITGSGTVTVSSDEYGNITIAGTGGGGGSTVTLPSSNITLSTTATTYITADGTSRTIGLPSAIPSSWQGTSATTVSKGNHGHGPITNGGYILGNTSQAGGVAQNQVLIANGDRIVIGDYSDRSNAYHKLKLTSIVFDGSTTTKFLSQKGTWEEAPIAIANNNAGSVMPVDTIGGINSIINSDLTMSESQQEILRPTDKGDIIYLLPIAMDEDGRLFLPISESFGAFLLGQNMGYSWESLL